MKRIIGIGLGAGALAGLAAFAYSRSQVAPLIARAIDYEEARSLALAEITGGHGHGHELFSRAVQENVGAGVGVIGYGMVLGVLFAVAFAVLTTSLSVRGRSVDSRWGAMALSAAGMIAVTLVPFMIFPGNPPGVGQEATSGQRTVTYLALLVISVAAAAALTAMALRLAPRMGTWRSAILAAWAYVAVIAVAATVLPRVQEVPGAVTDDTGAIVFRGFPAELLYEFRLQSVLTAAVLWMVLGTAFAAAIARTRSARHAATEVAHAGH